MEEGKYYYVSEPTNRKDWFMIGLATGGGHNLSQDTMFRCNSIWITPEDKKYSKGAWCYQDGNGRDYRLASPEEINWFEACHQVKKFIPLEEINIIHYQIF